MLDDRGAEYVYREYTQEPLSRAELTALFARLDRTPSQALRARDARQIGLDGTESDARILALMAEHPTLLERPILDDGTRAVTGRPVENLLALL